MPADRHPSQELHAAYRTGDTSPGTALALTVHAEICAVCRGDVQRFTPPARGGHIGAGRGRAGQTSAAAVAGMQSPSIAELRQSLWRWLSPGVRVAELHGASGLGEAVYLLKLSPGRAIPAKGLSALGHVVVLAGGLQDDGESYEPGDYLEAERQPLRRPSAARPDGSLCLIVTDGSWPGRGLSKLLAPLRGDEAD